MDNANQEIHLSPVKVFKWITVFVLGTINVYQFKSSGKKKLASNVSSIENVPATLQRRKLTNDIKSISVVETETGWKPIYVYHGSDSLEYDEGRKWHGQLFQDEMVMKILDNKENGYFIDLAAHDAVGLSNTFVLERNFGWKGLCVEMNHEHWYGLAKRNCEVIGAVVGQENDEEMTVELVRKHFTGVEIRDSKRRGSKTRRTASLKRVFELFNVPKKIDYFSLDVEGAEEFVMKAFPHEKYQFSVLTVEKPSLELEHILRKSGYTRIHHFSERETMWVHNSMDPRALIQKHDLSPRKPEASA